MLALASRSPRRRELLEALGVDFETVVPEVEELRDGEPAEVVLENARRKALAGMRQVTAGALVLGVDTDVVLDGRLLGKAGDESEARSRLEALSARTHEVLSGVVVLGPGELLADSANKSPAAGELELSGRAEPDERAGVARSSVTFRDLDEATVSLYLASGEWRDRAGAYAVQGLGSLLVERVEGDVSNVIGLPLRLLLDLAPELMPRPGTSKAAGGAETAPEH